MNSRLKFVILIVFLMRVSGNSREPEDVSDSEYIFTAQSLPSDDRYMSSVGNGHIATNVFSDSVYMNGFFNGKGGESHRARIPAFCNIRLNSSMDAQPTNYSLNARTGVFHVNLDGGQVEQRIFAHRFYTRAIVNQIIINPKNGESVSVGIRLQPGAESSDISFDGINKINISNVIVWEQCGRTKEVEDNRYQNETSPVCIYWTEVPDTLTANGTANTFTFVMTADTKKEVALKEMTDVLMEDPENLHKNHTVEWKKTYDSGSVEIKGNLELSKVVNGMLYYLLSSLPTESTNQDPGKFYGLSPGGLSRGGRLMDYQGHSFWDTETWMFPPILMLYPDKAAKLLEYRTNGIVASRENAQNTGYKGIRFPWESAFTGAEVTPDCCPEVVDFEQHITACIAFAARQYIAMTGDQKWLEESGCDLTREIAEFWASRAEFNSLTLHYDIKNVMGPDEDHPNVTNSVFTNVVAALALYLGKYTSCLCNKSSSIGDNWASIASRLTLLYDPILDYHPQFEGYERPTAIKQADVVLLGFPLLFKMNESTMLNDLMYYENVTRENGPAMTWSMHTVGHLRLGNDDQATRLFSRSYKPYVRDPYKIWTEAIEPEIGAVNFITGMGGFLQALMFGYGGLSIYLDRLEVKNPQLPPDTTELHIHGIKYLGAVLSLHIDEKKGWIYVEDMDLNRRIYIENQHGVLIMLNIGNSVLLTTGDTYKIQLAKPGNCSVPLDVIGQSDTNTFQKDHGSSFTADSNFFL